MASGHLCRSHILGLAVEPPNNGHAFGDLETHKNLAVFSVFLIWEVQNVIV